MKFLIPIKTVSEANKSSEHWTTKHKRHKFQKYAIDLYMSSEVNMSCLPCTIIMTRIAPRMLDSDDNLPMAFKNIKDYICNLLIPGKKIGRADSDPRIKVKYAQRKGKPKEYGVEIEIESNQN